VRGKSGGGGGFLVWVLSFLGMRGKGIFVREEVDLSVKGKGGFVCGKGFFLCGRKNDFIRRERSCRLKEKEMLSVSKLTFVRRRKNFRAQGGKFLCVQKFICFRKKIWLT